MNIKKTLIIRLTNRCNLNCIYCNVKKDNKYINDKKLINSLSKLKFQYNINKIILQGGEPFLYPINKLNKILIETKKLGIENIYCQTNGTLLNNIEILKIIQKHNIKIGISYDSLITEKTRKIDKKTLNFIRQFIYNYKIPIIFVYNKLAENEEYSIIKDLLSLTYSIKINPVFYYKDKKILPSKLSFANFLISMFIFLYNNKKLHYNIYPFLDIVKLFRNKKERSCHTLPYCMDCIIELNTKNNLQYCYRLNKFIFKQKLNIKSLKERIKRKIINNCLSCKYLKYCYGSCPAESENLEEKSYYCEDWKLIFLFFEKEGFKMLEKYSKRNIHNYGIIKEFKK